MSVINGNSSELIVKNGLILNLDAGNINSYVSGSDTMFDLSGNNNSGSLKNGTFFTSSFGGGFVFDGVDDYILTPLNIDANPYTVSAWCYPYNTSGERGIFLTDNGQWDKGIEINGGYWYVHNGSANSNTGVPASVNTWYNCCVVYATDNIYFYVNGLKVWTYGSPPNTTNGSTIEIGRANYPGGGGTRFFTGVVSTLTAYNRVLSDSEILQNYNANKSRFASSSTSYSTIPRIPTNGLVFDLDAANSKSYPGSGNTWYDLSGNNNNGTLTNGPTYSSANKGSIVFDGSNDSVIVPNSSTIGITGDMTIVSWIKATNFTSERSIAGKTPSSIPAPYDFYLGIGGNPKFFRGNGSVYNNVNATNAPAVNTWQNVCVTMAGTSVVHYLNGNVNSTGTLSTTIANDPASSLYVGNRADGGVRMLGNIGLVLIYNRALSAQEMLSVYNATKGRYGL